MSLQVYSSLILSVGSLLIFSPFTIAQNVLREGFESGDLSNFDVSPSGQAEVNDDSFGVTPTEGNFQGLLRTGEQGINTTPVFDPFAAPNTLEGASFPFPFPVSGFLFDNGPGPISALGSYVQGSALKFSTPLMVAEGETLEFDYNFLTDETNQTTPNNDLAFFSINQTLIPLTSVNTATLFDSATSFTSETNYQSFRYVFTQTETITLGFGIVDENAASGQSGLLLDNIRLSPRVPEPSASLAILFLFGLGVISRVV